ncbi:metallophosphoesterase [Candidatus Margulisiibacteriota bacterium]
MLLVFFLVLMILAPIIIRLVESIKLEKLGILLSYFTYCWMGFLFVFCSVSLLLDFYQLLIYLISLVSRNNLSLPVISTNLKLFIPVVLAIIISTHGYFEANNIRIERILIKSSKIPKNISPLKIAQISDLHLGLIVREKRLNNILEKIKILNPDILVSTGDLLDGQGDNLYSLIRLFQSINPKYGKYAVTGNHEFYAGLKHAINFTEGAGFRLLRGEKAVIPDVINIVGFDDLTAKRFEPNKKIEESDILKGVSQDTFTLLLKHSPHIDKKSLGLFDLQLSGHTHNGQIFPFNLLVKLFFRHIQGLIKLSAGSQLYISRGTGTWGPPMRFLASPEVTLIEII